MIDRAAPSSPPAAQSFASGFLFGEVMARCNLQPDFGKFVDKNTPDARINNFTRLQVRARPPVASPAGAERTPRALRPSVRRLSSTVPEPPLVPRVRTPKNPKP